MPAFIYKPPKDLEFTESGPSSEKTYARRRRTTENGNDNGYFNSETVTNAAPKCQPITNYDYVAWISIFFGLESANLKWGRVQTSTRKIYGLNVMDAIIMQWPYVKLQLCSSEI